MATINVQGAVRAEPKEYDTFSTVKIVEDNGATTTLFFALGKSQAVADAINTALGVQS